MEPFKTFYANYDGSVFTCCFRRTKNHIGHLGENSGAEIWNNAAYTEIKQNALDNRYLEEMCQNCIKKNAYPRDHAVKQTIRHYAEWLEDAYQHKLYHNLSALLKDIPSNGQILANQARARSSSRPDASGA